MTGVEFSPFAIAKAQKRVSEDKVRPQFLVGDVTRLDTLRGPFDASFDVGCFTVSTSRVSGPMCRNSSVFSGREART